MTREFTSKTEVSITLRDFLAMLMPKPPGIENLFPDEPVKQFLYEMKERYSMADAIIRAVR